MKHCGRHWGYSPYIQRCKREWCASQDEYMGTHLVVNTCPRTLSGFIWPKTFAGGNCSKAELMDNLGNPKGVGMRWGFVPSRAECGKLKHSFILGFTKSHLSNTLDPIKSNE